jgi:hypothetical protein
MSWASSFSLRWQSPCHQPKGNVSSEAQSLEVVASCQLTALCSEPDASLRKWSVFDYRRCLRVQPDILEVHLLLVVLDVVRFCRHLGRLI